MKLLALLAAAALLPLGAAAADGTVYLSNYPSNNPLLVIMTDRIEPLPVGSFVQVLGGRLRGELHVLSSTTGQTIFTLTEPGFFDAHASAVVPGVAAGESGDFQLRVWMNAPDYDTASQISCVAAGPIVTQVTGTEFQPAALRTYSFILDVGVACPEPAPWLLGFIGAGALLVRRRCV